MPFGDAERPLYEIKANLFKGLAHPYRIRILEILSISGEAAVSELITDIGLEASHVSQHLAVLRRHGLVRSERRASVVFYSLAFPEVAELLRVARQLLLGVLDKNRDAAVALDALPVIPQSAARRPTVSHSPGVQQPATARQPTTAQQPAAAQQQLTGR